MGEGGGFVDVHGLELGPRVSEGIGSKCLLDAGGAGSQRSALRVLCTSTPHVAARNTTAKAARSSQ